VELIAIFTVCAVSGVFTGLLGIGGGLIIVPAFLCVLPFFGIDHFTIHQIIGISATCVFFNSTMSLFYRRKEEFLARGMVLKMAAAIIVGTLSGAILSSHAPAKVLFSIYACVALTSIYLIKSEVRFGLENPRLKPLLYVIFMFIGAVSAAIGIGGAILFATALKCFFNKTPKELLPTITLLVAIHAVFAFIGKAISGDITLMIIPIAVLSSALGAKIGVAISRKLNSNTITNLMVITLILALIRVTLQFWAPD